MSPRRIGAFVTLGILASACGDPEAKAAAEQAAVRQSMAVAETTARQAAALPNTGLWSEAHLMDRLLRTGVAPRANDAARIDAPWMQTKTIALLAGGGELYAWIYPDSVARRAVTEKLDSLSAVPAGTVSPFPPPMVFVTNNNIAVVIAGGRVTNHERIVLAIQAGLPAAP
jgi:hypothetical protein